MKKLRIFVVGIVVIVLVLLSIYFLKKAELRRDAQDLVRTTDIINCIDYVDAYVDVIARLEKQNIRVNVDFKNEIYQYAHTALDSIRYDKVNLMVLAKLARIDKQLGEGHAKDIRANFHDSNYVDGPVLQFLLQNPAKGKDVDERLRDFNLDAGVDCYQFLKDTGDTYYDVEILKDSLVQWFVYYLPEFQSKRWNDNEESETITRVEILEHIFWQLIDTIKENLPEDNELDDYFEENMLQEYNRIKESGEGIIDLYTMILIDKYYKAIHDDKQYESEVSALYSGIDNEDKLDYARDDAYFILFLDSDIDMIPKFNSNEYIADNIVQLIIDNYVASGNQERLSEVLGE